MNLDYDNSLPFQPGQRVYHVGQHGLPEARHRGTATVIRVTRAKVGFTVVVQPDGERHQTEWFSANTRRVRLREVTE